MRKFSLAAAVLAAMPFASTALAGMECGLADQFTAEKIDAECREAFVSEMTNEQDKVDMRRMLSGWKSPADLEITELDGFVQVGFAGKDPLRIAYLSYNPLMVSINDKIYMDTSTNEPSWSEVLPVSTHCRTAWSSQSHAERRWKNSEN